MRTFIQPFFILVVFVLVRAGDLAISAAIAHQTVRAILYGIVAVLALVAILFSVFGTP